MAHQTRYRHIFIIAAIIAALGMVAYLIFSARTAPQATPPLSEQDSTITPTSAGSNETQPDAKKTYPVSVYFSKHPQSDDDPGATFPVKRSSPNAGVGKFAIAELLKQPDAAEQSQGYFTTVKLRSDTSTCGGADFTLAISDGVATLQFCKPFDHLGVVADGQADSELKATLKQFPTIKKVVILNSESNCEFDSSGENLCKQ